MIVRGLPVRVLALYVAAVASASLAALVYRLGRGPSDRPMHPAAEAPAVAALERSGREESRDSKGGVRLGGVVIDTAVGNAGASVEAATRALLARPIRLTSPELADATLVPDAVGFGVDSARVGVLAAELERSPSALRLSIEAHGEALEAPVILAAARLEARLIELKNSFDRRPRSARIDTKSGQVVADVLGRRLDVFGTMSAVRDAVRRGDREARLVAEDVPAPHREAELAAVRFDEVLGYFDTHYTSDRKHEARAFNLKLAASRFDGTVLFPGESFDFNEVVGPRTEAWGYKVAPVIASGELVDGVGGGTCQIAGTLHGAAFFAGLDILERHPHTRPSYYIKMGLDAAVAYPTLTLRLRNPFEFPIVLAESVRGGIVRAEILGPRRIQTVTFVRKIEEASRFDEREVIEPRLPRGERIVSQRGVPGFKVTRFRIVREGPFAYRQRLSDVYPSTSQIVRVGTGGAPVDPALHDDEHPEYVADDYLSVTQGPEIRSPNAGAPERGGGTTEVRVAGRYGMKGWSSKAGAFGRKHKVAVGPPAAEKPLKKGQAKPRSGGKATR